MCSLPQNRIGVPGIALMCSSSLVIEVTKQVVSFLGNTAELVSHSEVHRQILGGAPVNLEEQAIGAVMSAQPAIFTLERVRVIMGRKPGRASEPAPTGTTRSAMAPTARIPAGNPQKWLG